MNQRYVLGFPHSSDDYWTPYTLKAVKARYKHILSKGTGEGDGFGFEEIEEAVKLKFGQL
jgi:hypothetical protein